MHHSHKLPRLAMRAVRLIKLYSTPKNRRREFYQGRSDNLAHLIFAGKNKFDRKGCVMVKFSKLVICCYLCHSTLVFSSKADQVYLTGASHHRQARIRCHRKRSSINPPHFVSRPFAGGPAGGFMLADLAHQLLNSTHEVDHPLGVSIQAFGKS